MLKYKIRFVLCLMFLGMIFNPGLSLSQEVPSWVIEVAQNFAGFHTVISADQPRINCSHTHFFEVWGIANVDGIDRESMVIVDGDAEDDTVVGFVRFIPRYDDLSDTVKVIASQAMMKAYHFLIDHGFSIPPDYFPEEPALKQEGLEWKWEIRWSHSFTSSPKNTGRVMPDFILIEVDAEEEEVINYSKVHHDIEVSTTPSISDSHAIHYARVALDSLGFDSTMEVLGVDLNVVYPNAYFDSLRWEWSDNQALCWIVHFASLVEDTLVPSMDIWIDAHTGVLQGGEIYESPQGQIFGIPNQESDVNIQKHYLEMMQYNLTDIHQGDATQAQVTGSIGYDQNFLFILHTHGGISLWGEFACIKENCKGDDERLTQGEVPEHTLHYALMSFCESGHDGAGDDFKTAFVDQCNSNYFCFQGYTPSIDPDYYEDREFHHLAKGKTIEMAHLAAKSETGITFNVVFTYKGDCFNKIRLAPLWVEVSQTPSGNLNPEENFTMTVKVTNKEDAGYTQATGLNAQLIVPAGFTIQSGSNPQYLGTLNYGNSTNATWGLKVNSNTLPGTYIFDAKVWSDNLGVQVDAPLSPYHKRNVIVEGRFNVWHPIQVPINQASSFTVSVKDQRSGNPVPTAFVSVKKSGEVNHSGYTNLNGEFTTTVTPLTTGLLDITVTKQYFRTYIGHAKACLGYEDIVIRDCNGDDGYVPSWDADHDGVWGGMPPDRAYWVSPDIWVDVPPYTGLPDPNPKYDVENHLYACVHNIGSAIASNFSVHFYWAEPAIGLVWPTDWNFITSMSLPDIPALSQRSDYVIWWPPAPGHYCIFVRIESNTDPIVNNDAGWENNIGWKNFSVLPSKKGLTGDFAAVANFQVKNPDASFAQDVVLDLALEDWSSEWQFNLTSPDSLERISWNKFVFRSMTPLQVNDVTIEFLVPEGFENDTGTVHISGTIDNNPIGGVSFQVVPPKPTNLVVIAETGCVNPGDYVTLPILLQNNPVPFGGFELEVEFDYTAMTFLGAEMGELLTDLDSLDVGPPPKHYSWEYFQYRMLPCPLCGCCKYKILLLGMMDLPNGSNNIGVPIPENSNGELVLLHFVVNNDEKLRGLTIPVCWEWEGTVVNDILVEDWDCNENTFSSVDGNILYVSKLLCQYRDSLCDAPSGGIEPVLVFQNGICGQNCGGVDVCPSGPGFCKRGDVNYNTLPYEVADAVLFASYFAEGLSVFSSVDSLRAYQICATDVNADGRTLTLSDLVYLIRVILHDAVEIPKLAPSSENVNVIISNNTITTECASPIGAILFEFDGAVVPSLLADKMEMIAKDNKVLVWSREGHSLESIAKVVSFEGDVNLTSVTAVDRDSRELKTSINAKVVPLVFALHPAYPNPFNPSTNLSFTLPEALSYSLKIYNVTGQLVRSYEGMGKTGLNLITWDGKDNTGDNVASGTYFYQLAAGKFSATKKMVVVK